MMMSATTSTETQQQVVASCHHDDDYALHKRSSAASRRRRRSKSPMKSILGRKSLHKSYSLDNNPTLSSKSGGPPLSRRHTTQPPKSPRASTTRNNSTNHKSSNDLRKASLRRSVSSGNGKKTLRRSLSGSGAKRLSKQRRPSLMSASDNSSEHRQRQHQQCPATVSAMPKPGLLEKFHEEEQRLFKPCPLPSIMGDSIESGEEKNKEEQQQQKTEEETVVDDQEDDPSEHDNKSSALEGFFQFDPSLQADKNHVKVVPAEDVSIFPMRDAKTTTTTTACDDEEKKELMVEEDKASAASEQHGHETDENLTDEEEEEEDLAELVEEDQPDDERDINDVFGCSLVVMDQSEEEDGSQSDEEQPDEEEINKLFGSTWDAGFSLQQSDNALEHCDDDAEKTEEEEEESEHNDAEEVPDAERIAEEGSAKGQEEVEKEEDDQSSASGSYASSEEEEDNDDDVADLKDRDSNATQALLQFDHTTPDGLEFAACNNDDTSIFQMDCNRTISVPATKTAELSDLDKQLLQVNNSKKKDKRNSKFSAASALLRAKSFKRPKAALATALVKAESFRVGSTRPSLEAKGALLMDDTTDYTAISNAKRIGEITVSRERLLQQQQQSAANDTAGKEANRERNNSEDSEKKAKSGDDNDPLNGSSQSLDKQQRSAETERNKDGGTKSDDLDDRAARRQRRERDRIKGRRGSMRDKSNEKNDDEERRTRLRKRDALRKAVSARNIDEALLSPKKRSSRGGGRRGTTLSGIDIGSNSLAYIDTEQVEWNREGKDSKQHESKDLVSKVHRRSTMRKAHSGRNLQMSRSDMANNRSGTKQSLRRVASSDDGGELAARRLTSGGPRRRPTERLSSEKRQSGGRSSRRPRDAEQSELDNKNERHRRGKSRERLHGDRDGEHNDLDGKNERRRRDKSRERLHGDRRVSRRARRTKDNDGKADELDKSKERRRRDERRQMRRARRSKDYDSGGDPMDKSTTSLEESKQSMAGSSNQHSNPSHLDASSGGMEALPEDEGGSDGEAKATSSLRVERTFDSSFPDLTGMQDNISGTFHNDLGLGDTDRRKSFMKSLSVKIGAKQATTTLGKGARNLIMGGTRTEKRRLLRDMDDNTALS